MANNNDKGQSVTQVIGAAALALGAGATQADPVAQPLQPENTATVRMEVPCPPLPPVAKPVHKVHKHKAAEHPAEAPKTSIAAILHPAKRHPIKGMPVAPASLKCSDDTPVANFTPVPPENFEKLPPIALVPKEKEVTCLDGNPPFPSYQKDKNGVIMFDKDGKAIPEIGSDGKPIMLCDTPAAGGPVGGAPGGEGGTVYPIYGGGGSEIIVVGGGAGGGGGHGGAVPVCPPEGSVVPIVPGIPEPSEWALLAGGLGAVGYAARRAKEKDVANKPQERS